MRKRRIQKKKKKMMIASTRTKPGIRTMTSYDIVILSTKMYFQDNQKPKCRCRDAIREADGQMMRSSKRRRTAGVPLGAAHHGHVITVVCKSADRIWSDCSKTSDETYHPFFLTMFLLNMRC
jgi:hypothetical protein